MRTLKRRARLEASRIRHKVWRLLCTITQRARASKYPHSHEKRYDFHERFSCSQKKYAISFFGDIAQTKTRHENVTRGGEGGAEIFKKKQRAILTFLNSEFCVCYCNGKCKYFCCFEFCFNLQVSAEVWKLT